ncbi:MAG: SpoIID/LytB domain-containing protein [Myxococcota bacterium]|nr:SpoIID/LytB domain-containing protein [Myxococcota bacterium]
MRSILLGGWVGVAVSLWFAVGVPVQARADSDCETAIRVLLKTSSQSFGLEVDGQEHRFSQAGTQGWIRADGSRVQAWRGPWGKYRVDGMAVKGRVEVIPLAGEVAVIAHVPLNEYVEGALVGEIPALWAPEALRAQAVVSRTYALHQRAQHTGDAYDVSATTTHQVYKGSGAPPSIRAAVRDTGCRVLTHGGKPILAVFHSAAGGRTASAEEVWGRDLSYLVSREVDGEDDSPDTYWRLALSKSTLEGVLRNQGHRVGGVKGLRVTSRSASGRVLSLRVRGTRGQVELSGVWLRNALGPRTLKSTLFELREGEDGRFVFIGSGRGHGVGMSQWGARALARRGVSYSQILSGFYPGTRLENWSSRSLTARGMGGGLR